MVVLVFIYKNHIIQYELLKKLYFIQLFLKKQLFRIKFLSNKIWKRNFFFSTFSEIINKNDPFSNYQNE